MTALDLDGPEPLYEQIAAVLAARIADGTYPPRRRIPSEADICEEFSVARPTARSAVQLLRERGLVATVQGKGTYVTQPLADDGSA
jgi:GntR family transcriptional regulator